MTIPSQARDILGFQVVVHEPSLGVADLFRDSWPLSGGGMTRGRLEYRLDPGSSPTLVTPTGRRPLDAHRPGLHGYHLLLADVFGRIDDAFAVHASAVAGRGGAALILGPSGHGKTTLALELATRGAGFLSDDVGLISRSDGRVVPVPRTIHLRPGTRRLLSPEALRRAESARVAVDGERWMVDPRPWFGEFPSDAPLGAVLVIDAGDEVVTLLTVSGSESALDDLALRAGVVEVGLPDPGGSCRVTLRSPDGFEDWRRDYPDAVIAAVKGAATPPDFSAPPRLREIPRFDAAVALARHALNRHPGSRLAAEFEDRATAMVVEIAALLRGARCFALTPGRFDETVELVGSRLDP